MLHVQAQPTSRSRIPSSYTVMGKPMQRVDIPAKVTGGAAYVHDLRLPGMVHARVVRPPSYGARLARGRCRSVETMPGVLKVVRDGSFLAVVAGREYPGGAGDARAGAAARWDEKPQLPDQSAIFDYAQEAAVAATRRSSIAARSAEQRRSDLRRHYHSALPDARRRSDPPARSRCSRTAADGVVAHARASIPLRDAIAEMLRMPPEQGALHPHGRLGLLRPQRRR